MATTDTILVLGHTGLLGRAVVDAAREKALVLTVSRGEVDLARGSGLAVRSVTHEGPPAPGEADDLLRAVAASITRYGRGAQEAHAELDTLRRAVLEHRPRLVINCVGYTAVDQAEAELDLAYAVNARGARRVAQACAEAGSHLVHVSTDYVFDGGLARPYREDDAPTPLGVYGASKLAGERLVRQVCPTALVARTAWLFGPGRSDFTDKVAQLVARRGRITVVTDQVGSPTYTRDLAAILVELGLKGVGGLLHVVNSGRASRLELARRVLALQGMDPEMAQPCLTAELGLPAARPAFSVLDNRRLAKLIGGPPPSWLDALRRHLAANGEDDA